MEKVINILDILADFVIGVIVGFIIVVGIMYFTGVIEIHHLVAIPGVFEKYQICISGHEVYSWFVGNVSYV